MKNKIMWIDVYHSIHVRWPIISIKREFDTRAYYLENELSRERVTRLINTYPHTVEITRTKMILHIDLTEDSEPDVQTRVYEYLDDLRDSGVVNMFGAAPYLMHAFGFDKNEANTWLCAWMEDFVEKHSDG